MSDSRSKIKGLIKRFLKFEPQAPSLPLAETLLKKVEQDYAESVKHRVQLARDLYSIRATINMPELILDENWDIVGYSNSFLLLTDSVTDFAETRLNLKDFLGEGDFEKIMDYQAKVNVLDDLPYDEGRVWELRYRGPDQADRIGDTWLSSAAEGESHWRIERAEGKLKVCHRGHILDEQDCYIMYKDGLGSGSEDIKIGYTVKTSPLKKNIRDLSLVLSGSSKQTSTFPDITGYTGCTASLNNTVARIQRLGVDIATIPESLEPNTEYRIVVERTGGRLLRRLNNLRTGESAPPLKVIDPNAVYDLNDHFGFTTYSGDFETYDIEVHSRQSMFAVGQFRLPFEVEAGIRVDKLEGKIFKLRIGKDIRAHNTFNRLMFEDITDRKIMENELKKSREQLRDLAFHLHMILEQERREIAREIHDELGQALTALQLDLHSLKKKLPGDEKILNEKADSMLSLIDITNRSVQRISTHLRPALLDDLGLNAAIEWQFEEFEKRTGIQCDLELYGDDSALEEELSTAIFRIFQETLTNIVRHAGATRVSVSLRLESGRLILEVKDNGRGITKRQASAPESFGVIGMRERLYPWGGEVEISGSPDEGTTVRVSLALDSGAPNDKNNHHR